MPCMCVNISYHIMYILFALVYMLENMTYIYIYDCKNYLMESLQCVQNHGWDRLEHRFVNVHNECCRKRYDLLLDTRWKTHLLKTFVS